MKGWLDNFGKADNANDSNVSLPEGFVGLGYNTKGRNYSPAWGGQFQRGGKLNPVSPMQQVEQAVQPTPTVPYLQTKDPAEFYKSWIQSPEYERRLKSTGYSDIPNKQRVDELSQIEQVKKERLGLLENIQPLEYDPSKRSEAIIDYYDGSTINVNPSDYKTFSKQSVEAHEIAHVATPTSTMSNDEFGIFMGSMLPLKKPIVSGVQGSKEREASKEAVGDFEHLGKPWEAKADLDALRFMMYDKGIYDITKGKKFTESDFEKVKQSFGKERVFKRFTDRMGKKNFVNLMNTIALADDQEEAPIAMGGMSIPGSVGFSYARVAGAAPSKGKYAKKTMASAQNGIMSPMLLARNVLNYFYPNEEAAPAVEAAPVEYKKGLTNELLQRQAYKESTFNPAAVSPAGYKGLTQIGDSILKDYSKKKGGKKLDPFNPEDAVELQKFAMDNLYNSDFINKPNQPDSVRIAKTLAAYNWGRGNLSNYLHEQKNKGVDIYDSYDWLNNLPKETSDYVNKILLQEDPSFNKNYKKASTNPKYEEVTSLYDQKKFGGDILSAQNGQEMRFYQNGLDWKPKSMQDGGEEIYQGLELPEFVVEGKDERMKEAMSQGIRKFYGHVGELMGAPQKEAMQLITGKEQTPSEAWGFQNPGDWLDSYSSFGKNLGNLAMDAVLDPVNAIPGVGLIDDLTRGAVRGAAQDAISKTLKYGVSPYSYSPEVLARIPENLTRAALGKPKSLPKAVTEITEKNPQVKRTVEDTYNNREDAWSVYLGLPPENKGLKLVGSDEATGLSKYELTKPRIMNLDDVKDYRKVIDRSTLNNQLKTYLNLNQPGDTVVDSDKLFGVMGGYSKFISPDGKSIMYRDVWDLQPFSRFNSRELPTDMIGNAIRNFEVSSLIPGAKPFVSEGKLADIKTKYYPAKPYEDIRSRFNRELGYVSNYYEPEAYIRDIDNPTAEEIFNYDQMLRAVAKKSLMQQIKNEKTFLNPLRIQDSRKYADFAPYIKVDKSKKKDGGIIKDNKGYWNPDNWGQPVEIDSNDITMEGVYEPLLGVSDTGDTKLMQPGKNYKFKGKKVTEFPIAQTGKDTPAQQEVSRQDYLSKFNMYDDVLKSKNYTTPYYKDNNIDTSEGGMNCINGVCYMVSNIAGVKFDKAQTKDTYTGNATFGDNAMDEGYYRSNPEKEGFGVGDIFQYSRKKGSMGSRFPGEVDFKNENDLYPNHAVLIVNEFVKDGKKYFKIANNAGGDKVEIEDVPESELMNRYKKGYKTFDGGITYRYDPDRVTSIKKENEDRANLLKGKNPYANQYSKFDTSNLAFFNNKVDGLNIKDELVADKNLQKYADVYKTVYSDLGKGSNMPIDSFNKLIMNQVGIAGQETKFGELASNPKDFVPDTALPFARRAKEIYNSSFGTEDNWKKDYWDNNADNVQKEFSSYEDFAKSLASEDSDYNPYRTPRSIGEFQQKDLSERGNFYKYDLDSFEGQVKSSLALAVDNYHKLKAKYPDLSEDQIIDLTTLMHNAPGKALEPRFVNYYLKNNDVDYVDKVKDFAPKSFGKNQPKDKKVEWEEISPEKAKSITDYVKSLQTKRNGGDVGINQLDAQPMKKLNQLLNFTNNPDKDNWLDKYN